MYKKEIGLKRYVLLGESFLYIFFLFFIWLYISKFSLSLTDSLLYSLVPFLELSFIYLFFILLFSYNFFFKRVYVFKYIFLFVGAVYVVQGFTFFLSGNFLSFLAMENWRDYQYFGNKIKYVLIIFAPVPFCAYYFHMFPKIKTDIYKINRIVFSVLLMLISGFFFTETVRSHSSIISFADSISEILSVSPSDVKKDFPFEKFFGIDEENEYPFLRNTAYENTEYRIKHKNFPNVIVLFLEGWSARFIGAYDSDGIFKDITPNIDEFTKTGGVCKVTNYFNHTAATYRGIIGALTSGYPSHGGFENGAGWENKNNSKIYKQTVVSSIPKLLDSFNYKTVMFTPFVSNTPFNDMCKMLYFDTIYGADKSIKELIKSDSYLFEDILTDKGIFFALTKYLSEKEHENDHYFISLYNRGTHAFNDVTDGGKKYGGGDNQVLNRIHNADYELGYFLRYFKNSRWASNTYLIITTDHATFPEPAYVEVIKQKTPYYFVDKIPLIIYDPYKALPLVIDANSRNSLDLAPTILNLLGIREIQNSFLGHSLLDKYPYNVSMSVIGKVVRDRYIVVDGNIYPSEKVPPKYRMETRFFSQYIDLYRHYENKNMLFPKNTDK